MPRVAMLSTVDNPYDPFDDFDHWYTYDLEKGYNTCGLLARISETCSEFPEAMQHQQIEQAIDDFIALDCLKLFTKVVRDSK